MTQIDLEYRLLPWDSKLDNGEALKKKFGDDVGLPIRSGRGLGHLLVEQPGRAD